MKRFFIFLTLIIVAGVAIALYAWGQFYGSAVDDEQVIYLCQNDLGEGVVDSLILPNIKNKVAFKFYGERLNLNKTIKAGRYELKSGMSVVDVVRMFKLGLQAPVLVTFNNARGAEQLAGKIAPHIDADSISILRAITSPEIAECVGLKPEEMISLFIPNSYEMWWTTTPEALIDRMKLEYDKFWTPRREAAREELGLSRVEVSTLASIVYEESAKEDEMARVAGVYLNRLRIGMLLQADPTVKYAVGDFTLQRILYKHLEYDSPYNTYIYAGLPPGPIAVPSIAALDGVLFAEKHDYLYFCARAEMDGYHNFATTYSQHLANARKYSAELNRLGIR
ncbi:MAG: endolytic transglycosylase MltG [Rikenellaceae bacterium]